jgi:hypothetical protein
VPNTSSSDLERSPSQVAVPFLLGVQKEKKGNSQDSAKFRDLRELGPRV